MGLAYSMELEKGELPESEMDPNLPSKGHSRDSESLIIHRQYDKVVLGAKRAQM